MPSPTANKPTTSKTQISEETKQIFMLIFKFAVFLLSKNVDGLRLIFL